MRSLTKVVPILVLFLIVLCFNSCNEETPTNNDIQPINGLIFADSDPAGAEIFLQNTSTGKYTPDSILNLAPDKYDVRLKLNDFLDTSLVADVKAGLKTTVYVDFTPFFGNLLVNSSPQGAQIFLDNINTAKVTPATLDSLLPGQYEVTLKLAGFSDTTVTVQIHTGSQSLFIEYFPVTTTTTTTTPSTTTTVSTTTTTASTTTTSISTTTTSVSITTTIISGNATVSGVGSIPAGFTGTMENTRVALYTSINNWNFDITFAFTACDANGNYTISNFVPGVYYMDAWKDNDNNGVWGSAGDYIWIHGSGAYPNYILEPISFPGGQVVTVDFEVFVVP